MNFASRIVVFVCFCLLSSGVQCQNDEEDQNNGTISYYCRNGDGNFRDLLNCGNYIRCQNGQASLQRCPNQDYPFVSFFNRFTSQCERAMFPDCLSKGAYCPDTPDQARPSRASLKKVIREDNFMDSFEVRQNSEYYDVTYSCDKYEFDGLFGNPNDCQQFQICCHGIPYVRRCAPFFAFDAITLRCVSADLATCWADMIDKDSDTFKMLDL